jgi:menin
MPAVSFDDGHGMPSILPPQSSPHWQGLDHQEGDRMIQDVTELKELLLKDLSETTEKNNKNGEVIALWSCVVGYAESLSTHKQQRYHIFPLPWDALHRLVQVEFVQRIQSISIPSTATHRDTVKAIANTIWAQTLAKPNTRDEVHANSVYVWLRGRIDRKSLDCFGAALTTIAACHIRGLTSSQLTLSEDHAYERHVINGSGGLEIGTCEVAVPGNTKAAQAKRGREIAETFSKDAKLTPQTSWLYMASNPVVCDSLAMTLVAVMANINCTIDKQQGQKHPRCFASGQLYDFKRELLWVLYDEGHMAKFPFGLLELGDCEEHRGSSRSEEWVEVDYIPEPILQNEKLYWDAININKTLYNEAQVYPYFCESVTMALKKLSQNTHPTVTLIDPFICFFLGCYAKTPDTITKTLGVKDPKERTNID